MKTFYIIVYRVEKMNPIQTKWGPRCIVQLRNVNGQDINVWAPSNVVRDLKSGFKLNGKHITHKDYEEIMSLHDDRKWKNNSELTHGEWVKPVWPSNRSLQGSIPTPYIFDDRCRWDDVADRMMEWYEVPLEDRKEAGLKGREWMLKDEIGMSCKICVNDSFMIWIRHGKSGHLERDTLYIK